MCVYWDFQKHVYVCKQIIGCMYLYVAGLSDPLIHYSGAFAGVYGAALIKQAEPWGGKTSELGSPQGPAPPSNTPTPPMASPSPGVHFDKLGYTHTHTYIGEEEKGHSMGYQKEIMQMVISLKCKCLVEMLDMQYTLHQKML